MNDIGHARSNDLPAPPSRLDLSRDAFFFDFDGTLAPIVDDPQSVSVEAPVREALQRLSERSGGAVAIISGREIAQLDRFLAPLVLPAAGVHGMEMRGADGIVRHSRIDEDAAGAVTRAVREFADRRGLLAETKTGSVALHFRSHPESETACRAFAEDLLRDWPEIHPVQGKMVIEFKLGRRDKGSAIADFMTQPPFELRRPVFVGDDVTDEDGFTETVRRAGLAIKIGPEPTAARYRLADVAAHRAWLESLVAEPAP